MVRFYQTIIQSAMLYNQVCYFGNSKKADTERLDKVARTVAKTVEAETATPISKYHLRKCCCEKAAQDPVGRPPPTEPRAVLSSLQACLLPTAEVFQDQDQQIQGLFPAKSCQTAQLLTDFNLFCHPG